MADFIFPLFKDLVPFEVLEDPHTLEKFIKQLVPDLYDGDSFELKATCESIKQKYFDGDFNKDPLLKLMIISLVPPKVREKLQDQRWFPDESLGLYSGNYDFFIAISKLYSGAQCTSKDLTPIEGLLQFSMTRLTMKFFSENGLGIRVDNTRHISGLLKTMEESGMLRGISIKNVLKFPFDNETIWKWDEATFRRLLEEEMHLPKVISREEHDKYIKLLN